MSWALRDQAKQQGSPPLQGRGRGWGLSAERGGQLAWFAREMRCAPTAPEQRLWRALSNRQLQGFKFRRQAVVGPFIVDFLCPQRALAVEVDGETHEGGADGRRDAALAGFGLAVLHVTNSEVMGNLDGVRAAILGALERAPARWAKPHPPTPSPEGEGAQCADLFEGLLF